MLNLTLDSGAFSAFTQKKEINVKEYTDFCLSNKQVIKQVINLDVINPQDPDIAAQAGMDNFLYMQCRDVNAMPVYHARESFRFLDQMIGLTDYIGLSGTSLVSPIEDKAWHRLTWTYITDKQGFPIVKTHSFGNTSAYMALTFPWTSMDSATWMIQAGRAARVKLQGKSYQVLSKSIGDVNFISTHDTGLKREAWEMEIRELGLNPDALMRFKGRGAEVAMLRSYLVASDLLRLQRQTEPIKSYQSQSSLFIKKKQDTGGLVRSGCAKMLLVISPSAYGFNFPLIAKLGIKNVLVSYYYIATSPKGYWENKFVPFIEDPVGYCQRDPKTKRYWDKLHEVLLDGGTTETGDEPVNAMQVSAD